MTSPLEQRLNAIGPAGSTERLEEIARLDLGERSEAASRVLYRRWERLRYMQGGMTYEEACSCVRHLENQRNNNY